MTTEMIGKIRLSDYSLVGEDSALAVEKGLAEATWYASPVPKAKMRELLERRDGPAIRDTLLWFFLLGFFGFCGYALWGSGWAIIPFAIYGVLYASTSDSRWHESAHGTAFKTDWMNNTLYEIASFMVLRESTPWRWSHTRHHSDTIIVGRDPEIAVPRPTNIKNMILNFFNVGALRKYVKTLFTHCQGHLTPEELTYIPEAEHAKVIFRARIYVLIYASVIALAFYTRSLLPLMYIGLPSFYGAWLMVVYGYTQHAGLAENVLDHRLNCRTVYMNGINRYLYWNMNYHLEHHMFPLVPYHALPKLHALIKADSPPPYNGILEAYREIIPAVLRQVKDPAYHVKRKLPTPTNRADAPQTAPAITAQGRPVVDGWIEVCASNVLKKEDVIRFDHESRSYAIYRTADNQFFATDGICTHGNAHLADGMVKGTLIECPKHNGRFDIRDGSAQRAPACVALKTYVVEERQGKLFFDLTSAGGLGVLAPATTYSFRVVSNRNVATFIKELVLEPERTSPQLTYQPGDYMQFDIPVYANRSLQQIEVEPPYAAVWQTQHVFDFVAANGAPCRRNYSFASNPATDKQLRFNVRIATPPRGQACPAGTGSSYVFGLKPGDKVTAIGPFGDFHIKPSKREMVYLGGGAGMAPLRSHLAHLLETQQTTRQVSYWYGARSRQELFYQEYFEQLAQQQPNFSFHVALSEPQPEDQWQSHTGFIHEVLQQEYLSTHPDPTTIDYYLCGPPVMIQAATKMLKELGVPPAQIAYDEF
ncbi:MAG: NADH:ubiquinone reductase (Na(+)-transporting) subunit F [Chloroflexi bacterium]|nr:NADH:ubiquinone reductase (Na(+)-transporting) subunit F [Chloroflexota bacterium]